MNKPIFENEEEFDKFFDDTIMEYYKEKTPSCYSGYDVNLTKKVMRDKAKKQGYIKKSIIQEAEEMYVNTSLLEIEEVEKLIKTQHEAIQHLKKQLSEK